MTAAFVICEYNPFHNGHAYHLDITRKSLQPDVLVCVMSGHFTQRGSPAIADKWSRARMALYAGADLVLELHPVYACSSAESFARGALLTASRLGVGGWLSFGAENTNIRLLGELGKILNEEPEPFKSLLGASLKKGLSYAAARQNALIGCYANANANEHALASAGFPARETIGGEQLGAILKAPDNILSIEYIRAIEHYNLPFTPFAVQRAQNGGDSAPRYRNASAIRDSIRGLYDNNRGGFLRFCGDGVPEDPVTDDVMPDQLTLPAYAKALLASEFSLGRGPVFDDAFFSRAATMLIRDGARALRDFKDVSEGLERRLYAAARTARDYNEFIGKAATKRYPKSRVRRILTRFLLGYGIAETDGIGASDGPPYLRVLGFTQSGRKLLSQSKPSAPVITNYKKLANADPRSQAFMRLEAKATDIYVSAFQNAGFHTAGQDFIRGPARLRIPRYG